MARSQNGVNGNIQQQQTFPMYYLSQANSYPRNPAQSMYQFDHVPQMCLRAYPAAMQASSAPLFVRPQIVIQNQYSQQGFPQQMPHPIPTSIPQTPFVMQVPSNYQFSYPYSVPHNYPYPDVSQPQTTPTTAHNPPSQRKFSPLTVVDPNSNTDLDLSKFNQNKKNPSNQSLLDSIEINKTNSQCNSTEKTAEKEQDVVVKVDCSEADNVGDKTKLVSERQDLEDIQNMNSSDEGGGGADIETESIPTNVIEKPNHYHLKIDKKESDATTLTKKLTYDREYLIRLKNSVEKDWMPQNMPSTDEFSEEIILKEPNNYSSEKFYPAAHTMDKGKGKAQHGGKPFMNFKKTKGQKTINLDTKDPLPLLRSKSGYLPPQLRKKDDTDHLGELRRNIKGNLNKITPQNFQECLTEIFKLGIKEPDDMSCLIHEIFIKAVKEEAYSVTYAQFCNKLSKGFEAQSFKSELLKKCQDMFQTPLTDQIDYVRSEWQAKIEQETEEKMKLLYENDLEEQVKKAKDKYFGNIRFIGELFLHQLLAGKVILNCIEELLKGSDDNDSLLALCKLLETCGKQIDIRHKDNMNQYINQIHNLIQSKKLETRIQFKLRDVIDMRERDWILRHIQQEKKIRPKTLEEQKKENIAEAAATKANLSQVNKKPHQTINTRRNPVNMQKGAIFKNLSCSSHTVDEKTVLGPSGRNNWTEGSGSKHQLKPKDTDGWTPAFTKSKNPSIRHSNSRSREQSPQVKIKNRYRNLESSAEASGPDSRSSTPPIAYATHSQKEIKIDTQRSDEDTGDMIFQNLLSKNYFNDEDWRQLSDIPSVIAKWIDNMMEKDHQCRKSIGDNFSRLLALNMVTYDQIVAGTQEFVNASEDLLCDIPKLWEFFSQFLERFIQNETSDINFIYNIFKDILPNNDVAKCLSLTLHAASSRLGHHIVGHVFQKSNLDWSNIVALDFENFIDVNHLNFTIVGAPPLSPSGGHPLQTVIKEIDEILLQNKPNEDIFEYLEKHLDKPTWESKECTNTITCCILKVMKNQSDSVKREYLKEKKEIIKHLINHKTENQYEILKCILKLASDLDKETLTLIYDVLATDAILTTDLFDCYLQDNSLKSDPNFKLTENIISQLHLFNV